MMGGIPPSEAKRLTYWEFTAMRHEWNERHKSPADRENEAVEPPTLETVRAAQAELYELGIAGKAPN
jgi:hypothetical protein